MWSRQEITDSDEETVACCWETVKEWDSNVASFMELAWVEAWLFSFSSATDLRPNQVEPEDTEDELDLEDSCSHDENEEEEGKESFCL